jgi:hypothetical protein
MTASNSPSMVITYAIATWRSCGLSISQRELHSLMQPQAKSVVTHNTGLSSHLEEANEPYPCRNAKFEVHK